MKRLVSRIVGPLVTGIILSLVLSRFAHLGAPITEGWWHVYVYWMNAGKVPYRDFELLVGPIYPTVLRVFETVGVSSFTELRTAGIVVCVIIGLLLFEPIRKIYGNISAISISVSSVLILSQGPAFITYDYDQFAALFLVATIAMLSALTSGEATPIHLREQTLLFGSGAFASLCLLTKTSIGFASIATVVAVCAGSRRLRKPLALLPAALGLIAPALFVFFWTYRNSAFGPMIQDLTGGSSAKGGLTRLLTRSLVLLEPASLQGFVVAVAPFVVLVVVLNFATGIASREIQTRAVVSRASEASMIEPLRRVNLKWFLGIVSGVILALRYHSEILSLLGPLLGLPAGYGGVFAYAASKPIRTWLFPLACASLLVAITTIWSAGLSPFGVFLGFSCLTLVFFENIRSTSVRFLCASLIVTSFAVGTVENKTSMPYAWWGLNSHLAGTSDRVVPNGLSAGLRDSTEMVGLRASLQYHLMQIAECGGEIVQFPHAPAILLDAGHLPEGRLAQYWYDFSSTGEVQQEASRLSLKQISGLVVIEPPDDADAAHERLFGPKEGHTLLKEVLMSKASQEMRPVLTYEFDNSLSVQVFADKACTP